MNFLFRHFRLIPLLLIVAGLAFVVRVGDFVSSMDNMGAAHAVEEVKDTPPPMTPEHTDTATAPKTDKGPAPLPDPMAKADAAKAEAAKTDASALVAGGDKKADGTTTPDLAKTGEKVNWKDSTDTDVEDSQSRDNLYKDLSKRRDALDKREKEIGVREALLSAAERELDQKTRELTALRTEIQAAIKKRSDEEDARINSLVKIYEGMKPKDAASIFNTLDLDVLMVIMTKMSERKSSPVLALMSTDRAKTVTTMMAEQKKTPELPAASN